MATPSFIPGYKNLITETLYQKPAEQTFVTSMNTNAFQQSLDFQPEKNGQLIQAYYHQYASDTPYKNAIFTPSVVPTTTIHKQCNPLVAYPFGVPQTIEYEKCSKCKGDMKCSKTKKIKRKNQDVKTDICLGMKNNSHLNDDGDLFTSKLKNECSTNNNKVEGHSKNLENILTCDQSKYVSYVKFVGDSTYSKSSSFNFDALPSSNNSEEIYSHANGKTCGNMCEDATSNDVNCFMHMNSNSVFSKNDHPLMNIHSIDNFDKYTEDGFISNEKYNNVDLKTEASVTHNGRKPFDSTMSSEYVIYDEHIIDGNEQFYLKINSENVNDQHVNYGNHAVITENVIDPYDLPYNPFTQESYTNQNTKENAKENQFSKEENDKDLYLQKQETKVEEKEEKEENKEEENENEELPYKTHSMASSYVKTKKESQLNEMKNTLKLEIDNNTNGKDGLTKRILKKKKKNMSVVNNSTSKITKIDESQINISKASYTRFDIPKKSGQKRVCKLEKMIEEAAKHEVEGKGKSHLKQSLRISMSNADELFSPNSTKRISHRKRTLASKTNKYNNSYANSNKSDLKTELIPRINIPDIKNQILKKSGTLRMNNKIINSSTKSINAYANKKKELAKEKITSRNFTKKINAPTLIKTKTRTTDISQKNLNKPLAKELTENITERSENKENEEEIEGIEEIEEIEEEEPTNRKLLLSRSTTMFIKKKKTVPFKDIQVKRYSNNVTEVLKTKETIKFKKTDLTDRKRKIETGKGKKNVVVTPDIDSKSYRKVTIAGKLKSKKKELYANILSLTKNIKAKESVEESKKKRERKI